jgi:hypothetical protein
MWTERRAVRESKSATKPADTEATDDPDQELAEQPAGKSTEESSEESADKPAGRSKSTAGARRKVGPAVTARSVAERTWWLPWLLGAAVVVIGVAIVIQVFGDAEPSVQDQRRQALPHSTHTVVYEVTGAGKSPEIRFVSDGSSGTDRVVGADMPWRKELSVTVGPTVGVVQVLAGNSGLSDSISCSIRVDGQLVNQQTTKGEFSSVSCSAPINP